MDIDRICIDFKAGLMGIYGLSQNGEEYILNNVKENYIKVLDLLLKDNQYTKESEIERISIDFEDNLMQVDDDFFYFTDLSSYFDKIVELFGFELINTSEIQEEIDSIIFKQSLKNASKDEINELLANYQEVYKKYIEDSEEIIGQLQLQKLMFSVLPFDTTVIMKTVENFEMTLSEIKKILSEKLKQVKIELNNFNVKDTTELLFQIYSLLNNFEDLNQAMVDFIEKNINIFEDSLAHVNDEDL